MANTSRSEVGLREQLKEALIPLDRLDKEYTKQFAICASKSTVCQKWRSFMKALEISCHGVMWIGACLVCLWFSTSSTTKQVIVNIMAALILDLIIVAVIKASVRRGRPPGTKDMFLTFSIDNYSFPSGHASRGVMLALLVYIKDFGSFLSLLTSAWAIAVSGSRVLLGRHHIGDVLAGILLGLLEAEIMYAIWFNVETTESILQFFTMFEMFHAADSGL